MKTLRSLLLAVALALVSVGPAGAAFPWGLADPLEVTSTTPTCTYSATAFFCISTMTGNTSALTLAGMTKGTYYAISFVQDGTGTRTLTQTPITQATGGPAVPAITTAANSWTTWVILATSASAATFVSNWDNVPIFDTINSVPYATGMTLTSPGTQLTTGTMLSQGSLEIPGFKASDQCTCSQQTLPATWQTGIIIGCLPGTNLVTCEAFNPTAGSITPAAITLNVRVAP